MKSRGHAVPSVTLVAVAFLVLPVVAGAGIFAPTQALPDDPVPWPQDGDRGRYAVHLEGAWADDGPERSWAFTWQAPGTDPVPLLPDARPWTLHTWGEDWPTDHDDDRDRRMEPTGLLVQGGQVFAAQVRTTEAYDGAVVGPLDPLQNTTRWTERTEFMSQAVAPCLVHGLHQGVPLDATIDTMPCHLPFVPEQIPEGLRLEPVAVETLPDGLSALHATGSDGEWSLDTWVAPNTPYPLRLVVAGPEGRAVYSLIGVAHGTGSQVTAAGPVPEPVSVPVAPRTSLGPDAGQWQFPWTMEAFHDAALNDPIWPDLRDFLDAHPDAEVVAASSTYQTTPGGLHQWWVEWSDGDASFSFSGKRPAGADGPVVFSSYRPLGDRTYDEADSDPGTWPETLPTYGAVGDLLWSVALERGEKVPRVLLSHRIGCTQPCDDPQGSTRAWILKSDPPDDSLLVEETLFPGLERDHGSTSLKVDVDHQGQVRRVIDATSQSQNRISTADQLGALRAEDAARPDPATALAPYDDLGPPVPWGWVGAGLLAVVTLAILASLAKAKAAVWVGFTRIRNSQVLKHPLRARLLELVQEEPGVHLTELTRRLETNKTTALHHVRKLLHAGLLWENRDHGYTCYYAARSMDYNVMAAVPLLKSEAARRIVEHIMAHPGANLSQVAEHAGIKVSTANYHLERLKTCGIVEAQRKGRAVSLRASPLARQALAVGA